MTRTLLCALTIGLLLPAAAVAQTPSSSGQQGTSATNQSQTGANAVTAQKLKKDLQGAGFTDVNVMPEAFVVQAKTKDGNPVVMTIGPHGMTAFEAIHPTSGNSTSGSGTSGTGTGATGGANQSK